MSDEREDRTMRVIKRVPDATRILAFIVQSIVIMTIVILRRFLNKICEKYRSNYQIFSWRRRIILQIISWFEWVVFNLANALLWDSVMVFPFGWFLAGFFGLILEKLPVFFVHRIRTLSIIDSEVLLCIELFTHGVPLLLQGGLLFISFSVCCIVGSVIMHGF